LARRRVPEKLPNEDQKLFEHANGGRVFLIPAALEERRGSAKGGQEAGCISFGSFSFGQAKKMNMKLEFFYSNT